MNRTSLPAPEQKEHARHGEQLFPLQKYITTLDDLHPSVSAHWHEEAEFTRILSGSGTYQIQLQHYDVAAGDLLFIPPALLHAITVTPREKLCTETYVFHAFSRRQHRGHLLRAVSDTACDGKADPAVFL